MNKKIISLVGQRALPVVSPIFSYVKYLEKDNPSAISNVMLIYNKSKNDEIKKVAETSQAVLEQDLHLKVSMELFESDIAYLEQICHDDGIDEFIFNFNPGPNWQIALLCYMLYNSNDLKEKTILLASDTNFLYRWRLGEDIAKADKITLSDLSLPLYQKLNTGIEIKNDTGFSINRIDDVRGYDHLKAWINESLVWIRERRGYLHLLFDLDATHATDIKRKDLFRLITSVFDPLHYDVAITSTDTTIQRRAKIESIESVSHDKIKDWIKSNEDVKPKDIVPNKPGASYPISSKKTPSPDETLFLCLGSEVLSTLKAIYSYMGRDGDKKGRNIVVYYDEPTKRIKFIAENMLTLLKWKGFNITLSETDHLGGDIISKTKALKPGNAFFNYSPGTKTQTLALVSAALSVGQTENIYSILTKGINKNLISDDSFKTVSPPVEVVIKCLIPSDTSSRTINCDDLWEYLLNEIDDGQLTLGNNIEEIKIDGKTLFSLIVDGKYVRGIKAKDQTFYFEKSVEREFFDGGFWWEQTVAYAIKKQLKVEPLVGVKWMSEGESHTELDIVFNYDEHICVVSCKTYRKPKALDAFLVRSETTKRIGRFAVAFLALPREDHADTEVCEVKVLSPRILSDEDKLRQVVHNFASSKRSTSDQET